MPGFVSFVGSGPGDPDLLTLKAVDRLSKADAVLFDDLSSGPILDHARPGADLVGVGKRAGRASPKQHHVSRLLVEYAQLDQRVVRLKHLRANFLIPQSVSISDDQEMRAHRQN